VVKAAVTSEPLSEMVTRDASTRSPRFTRTSASSPVTWSGRLDNTSSVILCGLERSSGGDAGCGGRGGAGGENGEE
jgi:hypothetical protein